MLSRKDISPHAYHESMLKLFFIGIICFELAQLQYNIDYNHARMEKSFKGCCHLLCFFNYIVWHGEQH